jgi:Spy/CpxP family protein refolding chaperone
MLVSLAVVFAAGLAVGLAVRRHDGEPPRERRRRSWLADELSLTPGQQSRMEEIWSQAMQPPRNEFAQRGQIYEDRDAAVRSLLTDEQKLEYDRIFEEAARKMAELGEARRKAFEDAVARTKEMLTPEQRLKYEEMLTRGPEPGRGRRRGRGRSGGPGPMEPGDQGPTAGGPTDGPAGD